MDGPPRGMPKSLTVTKRQSADRVHNVIRQAKLVVLMRCLSKAHPFTLAVLITCALALLIPRSQAQQYVFDSWNQDQGLGNISIAAMTFDHKGVLWIATGNGVYRFLGVGPSSFVPAAGIPERLITDIYTDISGNVWAGTYSNLYRWNGNCFVPATRDPVSIWNAHHIAALDATHLLVVDRNKLYLLTHDGGGNVVSYQPFFPASLMSSNSILAHLSAIAVAPDGSIWMGCTHQICTWGNGNLKVWSPDFARLNKNNQEFWVSFHFAKNGSVWATTMRDRAELTPGSGQFVVHSISSLAPGEILRQTPIAEDAQGRILTSTTEGLARWNGAQWTIVSAPNGLSIDAASCFAFDANGNLWIGTGGRGLVLWAGYGNLEAWTRDDGLPASGIWSILPVGNGLFVGTDRGIASLTASPWAVKNIAARGKWRFGQVSGLFVDVQGMLWAGTFSGDILRIDPATGHTTLLHSIPALIFKFIPDGSGRVWIPTGQGIYSFDPSHPQTPPRRALEPEHWIGAHTSVSSACRSADGSLWFLTSSNLVRFHDGSWSHPDLDRTIFSSQTDHGGLSSLSCAPDGSLWTSGDRAGVWHLAVRDGILSSRQLQLPEEFSGFSPVTLAADSSGRLWIGTDRGVLVWNGSGWRHLTHKSGLVSNDIDQGAIAEAPDGSLWIGSSGGLIRIAHPSDLFWPVSLDVNIYSIQRGASPLSLQQDLVLPWSGQPLRLQFAAPAVADAGSISFFSRLIGVNSSWISTGGEVIYPSLGPGAYRFEVFARNSDNGATSTVQSVSFRILPPWWRSWWFCTLATVIVLAVLWWLYRLRVGVLESQSRTLEETVRERTRDLELSRESLRIQASHDALTGLYNRGAILEVLERETLRVQREHTSLTVALADIDYFKQVNDTYGHLTGDAALRAFAAGITANIRPYDYAGRYGGEEFLLILPNLDPHDAEGRLAQLHAAISHLPVAAEAAELVINWSMGAVILDPSSSHCEVSELVSIADEALYEAKRSGRDRLVVLPFHPSKVLEMTVDSTLR